MLKRLIIIWCVNFLLVFPVFVRENALVSAADQELMFSDEEESAVTKKIDKDDQRKSQYKNAVLEGVQISREDGEEEHEKIYSCYFIFREEPTSYFYEVRKRNKQIVFEFNDVELGASPIPSQSESPIQGFRVEEGKVDVNAEIQGLKPEWHDIVKVTFYLDEVPKVTVKDEYSIVSFSFKWTTDPEKLDEYIVEDKGPKILLFSLGGLGLVGGGVAAYVLLKGVPPPSPEKEISIDDLPEHPYGNHE